MAKKESTVAEKKVLRRENAEPTCHKCGKHGDGITLYKYKDKPWVCTECDNGQTIRVSEKGQIRVDEDQIADVVRRALEETRRQDTGSDGVDIQALRDENEALKRAINSIEFMGRGWTKEDIWALVDDQRQAIKRERAQEKRSDNSLTSFGG